MMNDPKPNSSIDYPNYDPDHERDVHLEGQHLDAEEAKQEAQDD